MRDPALHIKKSDLIKVLKTLDIDIDITALMTEAVKYPIVRDSNLLVKTKRTRSTAQKTFQLRLAASMAKRKQFYSDIKPSNKSMWSMLNTVTKNAEQFGKDVGLTRLEAFDTYINIGLKLFGNNYRFQKFVSKHEEIVLTYVETKEADTYSNKGLVRELLFLYCRMAGVEDYQAYYDTYKIDFMKAAKQIETVVDSYDWLYTQFFAYATYSIKLSPSGLHGEKAQQRYLLHKPKKTNYTAKQRLLRGLL